VVVVVVWVGSCSTFGYHQDRMEMVKVSYSREDELSSGGVRIGLGKGILLVGRGIPQHPTMPCQLFFVMDIL
jgi:hypothetical protein